MTEVYISFDGSMITVLDGPPMKDLWALRANLALQSVIEDISYDRHQRAPVIHLHEGADAEWVADHLNAMET